MPNGRIPIGWLVIVALLGSATMFWLQPYSVVSPYREYVEPARRFLRAALDQDTLELRKQAISSGPVRWALRAAHGDPNAVAIWAQRMRPYSGRRHGDTTTVVFQTGTRVCYLRPVTMAFVHGTEGPRVALASSSCFAGQ